MNLNKLFPNLSTEGYYNFFNQTIVLNKFDKENLTKLQTIPSYEKFKKFTSLAIHEYTHYIDSFSTLWGIDFLFNLYNVYFIDDIKEVPKSIHLKNIFKHLKTIETHNYYTKFESLDMIKNTIPWKYSYSLMIDNGYPFIKIQFRNKNNDSIVCNTPVSLLSIIESSAMSQEILSIIAAAPALLKYDDFEKTITNYKNYLLLYNLYHRELTEYSTSVHIVANSLNITDIIDAYKITSILSRFVLNFPSSYFPKLNVDNVSNQTFKIESEFKNLISDALHKNNDRALLFLFIAIELENSKLEDYSDDSIHFAIKDCLIRLGVTLDSDFINEVNKEYIRKSKFLTNCKYYRIEKMAEYGFDNFQTLGLLGPSIYDFSTLKLPYVILGDNTEMPIFKSCFNDISPIKHYEHVLNGEKSLKFIYNEYRKSGFKNL